MAPDRPACADSDLEGGENLPKWVDFARPVALIANLKAQGGLRRDSRATQMQEVEDIGWVPLLAITGGVFLSILLLLLAAPRVGFMVALILSIALIVGSLAVVILVLYRRRPTAALRGKA